MPDPRPPRNPFDNRPPRPPAGGNASGLDDYQTGLSPQNPAAVRSRNAGGGMSGEAPSFEETIEIGERGEFFGHFTQKVGSGLWTFVAHASLGIVPAAVVFSSWAGRKLDEYEAGKMEAKFTRGEALVEPGKRYEITGRTKGIDLSDTASLDGMHFFYGNIDEKGNLLTTTGHQINKQGQAVDANGVPLPGPQQPTRDIVGITNLRKALATRSVLQKYEPLSEMYTPLVTWLARPQAQLSANIAETTPYVDHFRDRFVKEVNVTFVTPLESSLPTPTVPGLLPAQVNRLLPYIAEAGISNNDKDIKQVLQDAIDHHNALSAADDNIRRFSILDPTQVTALNMERNNFIALLPLSNAPLVSVAIPHSPAPPIPEDFLALEHLGLTAEQVNSLLPYINRDTLARHDSSVIDVLNAAIRDHNAVHNNVELPDINGAADDDSFNAQRRSLLTMHDAVMSPTMNPQQVAALRSFINQENLADEAQNVHEVLQDAISRHNATPNVQLIPNIAPPVLTPERIANFNVRRNDFITFLTPPPISGISSKDLLQLMSAANVEDLANPHKSVAEVLQAAIERNNTTAGASRLPDLYGAAAPLSKQQITALNDMRSDLINLQSIATIATTIPLTLQQQEEFNKNKGQAANFFKKELTKADAAIEAANNSHLSLEDNLKVDLLVLEQMRAQKIEAVKGAQRELIRVNTARSRDEATEADTADALAKLNSAQRDHDDAIEKINASSQRIRAWYLQLQGHKFEPEMKQSWTNKIAAGLFGREESETAAKIYSERHGLNNIGRWRLEYRDIVDPADPNNRKTAAIRCTNKLISKSQARDIGGTLASQALKKGVPTATATGFEAKMLCGWKPEQLTKILEAGPLDKNGNKNAAYENLSLSMQRDAHLEVGMQDCMGIKLATPKEWDKVDAAQKSQLIAMKDAAKKEFITEVMDPLAQQKFGKAFNALNTLERAAVGQAHMSMDNKEAHPYVRMLITQNKDKIQQETGITNADVAIAKVAELAAQTKPAGPIAVALDPEALRERPR